MLVDDGFLCRTNVDGGARGVVSAVGDIAGLILESMDPLVEIGDNICDVLCGDANDAG